jgi:hypothetical protein
MSDDVFEGLPGRWALRVPFLEVEITIEIDELAWFVDDEDGEWANRYDEAC